MLRELVKARVEAAMAAALADGSLPEFEAPAVEIMRPKQADHGDYSCNVALVAAAAIRKAGGEKVNPRQIAQAIADHLEQSDLLSQVELAGPGFINIRLAESWLQQQVAVIIEQGQAYGNIDMGAGQRWQVEYVSANPTGPIHYGGARNAVLGDVLANVLEAAGYQVQREFYVNDGGTQFQLFAETLYARYAQLLGRDVPLPPDGYQGEYMVDYARKIVDQYGDRFLQMEQSQAVDEIRQAGRTIVLDALQTTMARIGVVFDNWFSEQSLYDEGLVEQALDYLENRGELDHRDGAVWFTASKYPNNEKDAVVIRSNGSPTYFASDIAYHYDKFVRRRFDTVIDVWGVDHQGHVARMAAMMHAFGLDPQRLVILLHDLVKLVRDGAEVKLSKRAGNIITLDEVVDEVGADAIRYNLMTRSPESTIEFDLDLAVKATNENPVFYIQYGHARICSILGRAEAEGLDPANVHADAVALSLLTHPSELALIRKLIELEEQIELAVEKLSPHNLTYYALDLTRIFSAFYRDCMVVDKDHPELSRARLMLSMATRIVLAKTLTLLGVGVPESM